MNVMPNFIMHPYYVQFQNLFNQDLFKDYIEVVSCHGVLEFSHELCAYIWIFLAAFVMFHKEKTTFLNCSIIHYNMITSDTFVVHSYWEQQAHDYGVYLHKYTNSALNPLYHVLKRVKHLLQSITLWNCPAVWMFMFRSLGCKKGR